jgi:CDP-2,3-bis-(O-geranylgeranyl)-sn-glycerol synthase
VVINFANHSPRNWSISETLITVLCIDVFTALMVAGDIPLILAQAFWFMVPAFAANPLAVLFGGGRPIDSGLVLRDGQRLLGDGKTWRGLGGGIILGMLIGGAQHTSSSLAGLEQFAFGDPFQATTLVFLLPLGALLGDMLGSFGKRRMKIKRGAKTRGLDQYDFLIGTVTLLLLFQTEWVLGMYVLDQAIIGLIFIVIITPVLHRAVNILGYRLGKKDVPW